ncbi:hypothetical protein H6G54_09145 [Anabaena cylindrica FACHB-243]|uniref:Uncharacterized protein n=1 Tax=Anabaena cylindrica (strain ATCC 27899 / PCC 7122) TaxID=272123 RepID=K9ZP19_ANACC|nr:MULTISPECIES: hypothetical protein [Anabaena]AFZ60075.1 hypothetical protein Anacy_4729 [Anabaena cylindrica PCC 7122]MBD2417870.1 hypothetical protein [Anabaena cylindrica FACHB-243]MBY5282549.1 hypothetical protein [Anabaena sp. CCAP 1446/1C]MBY5310702.1 hypothetical protein [Anabaena sp. CCAP 1446/1C]MCM2404786.1 hypothetical protein [Anabaena sp. CCAP 1446/1C]
MSDQIYNITVENQDLIIRFKKDIIELDTLKKFLDYLELESFRKKSSMTIIQAEALAKEIDIDVWSNIKHKFVGE